MGIRTYLPREGTEIIAKLQELNRLFCIRTYLPREGTETCCIFQTIINFFSRVGIRTYLPREGPETKSRSQCGLHLEK